MRIEGGKLVGAYVSDVQTSGRNTIYTISDSDNTPTREFTTYEYVQTEQLARMGISVNPNGAITVDHNAYQNYQNVNNIDTDIVPFYVKFKGALYACDLTDVLENGATPEFLPIGSTSYPKIENNIKIPATTESMAGKVLTVGADYTEWKTVKLKSFVANYVNTNAVTINGNTGGDFYYDKCTNEDELIDFLGDGVYYGNLVSCHNQGGSIVIKSWKISPYDSANNSIGSLQMRVRNVTSTAYTLAAEAAPADIIYYKLVLE